MSVTVTEERSGFREAGLGGSGRIPGLVALVSRGDETHVGCRTSTLYQAIDD
ncbi:hypothetical protein [Paractinoplanes hotanensis]|uniref:Uncharacterized protein n=1 Tax=Paractinoplanes hotanensis TaxID=2906497 RepID=A0ABT0Y4S2_9ACTN|nr:hypothetical protein [Actinoplanes hotanensis]MCM4081039.1 hypothetical protein [Actinoplanes hotanensis]